MKSPLPILSRSLLHEGFALKPGVSCGPLDDFPEKILQFGEGNFLRAFADWMVDRLNARHLFEANIVALQPLRQGMVAELNRQEGIYTLISRGVESGKVVESRRIVTSISRGVNPYENWETVLELARSKALRYVFSHTTEAGIVYTEEPYVRGQCPNSFPAKITALLYERFNANPAKRMRGLVFLPCELIEKNGATLREYVLKHATDWRLGNEFILWIKSANYFLNTLVDRIVMGYPRAEAEELDHQLGYHDQLLTTAEIYHLWVIEGPMSLAEELPLHRADLNVVWTDSLSLYRSRKVRILDGAHTASILVALLSGLNTTQETMEDAVLGAFIRKAIYDEIVPSLTMYETGNRAYADAAVERLGNVLMVHELAGLALNSVSKWKVRVLPTLLDVVKLTGKLPPLLSFSLAALIRFYDGRPISETELRGTRGISGETYTVRDDPSVLVIFAEKWATFHEDKYMARLVGEILENEALWGQNLVHVPGLVAQVTTDLSNILSEGVKQATAQRVG